VRSAPAAFSGVGNWPEFSGDGAASSSGIAVLLAPANSTTFVQTVVGILLRDHCFSRKSATADTAARSRSFCPKAVTRMTALGRRRINRP